MRSPVADLLADLGAAFAAVRVEWVTLLRIQEANIDFARVRGTLQALESALGQSDLIPAFERALERAREGRR